MKVGFVGLGLMGVGMAANLVKAGHEVTVYNRTRAKMDALVEQGARAAATLAQACAGDAVMTMLSNDEAVEEVVFGEGGILASLPVGAAHVSASTISAALSERLEGAHARAGQRYVSAPVFGRPDVAAAGALHVLAAGAPQSIAAVRPLLDAIGQSVYTVSEQAKVANIVKLSGNFLFAAVIEALGEAIALVGKAGVDRRQYFEFLTSTIFDTPVYRTYGELIVDRSFEPPSFAAVLGHKDIKLALAAADELRVAMPFASILRDRFLTLLAHGGDQLDWAAIGVLAASDAGKGAA